VTRAVNAQGIDVRSSDDIKNKWLAMKKLAKQQAAYEKNEMTKTGMYGGWERTW
jgi:hypothetical protein